MVVGGLEVIGRQIEIRTRTDGKSQATVMGAKVELRRVRAAVTMRHDSFLQA